MPDISYYSFRMKNDALILPLRIMVEKMGIRDDGKFTGISYKDTISQMKKLRIKWNTPIEHKIYFVVHIYCNYWFLDTSKTAMDIVYPSVSDFLKSVQEIDN